jgi:hypothetical protein
VQPINTLPIQQFLTQVKNADASKAREIKINIEQAKNLAFTLGIVMSRLQGDLEKLVAESKVNNEEVISVELNGGSDWK